MPGRRLEGEAGAAAGHDVDREMRVAPVLELRRDPSRPGPARAARRRGRRGARRLGPVMKSPSRVAHGRAAVAASAGLVEHQRSVLSPEAAEQLRSLRGHATRSTVVPSGMLPEVLASEAVSAIGLEEAELLRVVATPAGSSSAGSGRASCGGSRGRCRSPCSRRTPRAPGRRGSSSSTRDRPGWRGRRGRRCSCRASTRRRRGRRACRWRS